MMNHITESEITQPSNGVGEALRTAMATGRIVSLNGAAPASVMDDHAAQRLQTPVQLLQATGLLR